MGAGSWRDKKGCILKFDPEDDTKNAHRRGSGGSPGRSSHATDEDELSVEVSKYQQ